MSIPSKVYFCEKCDYTSSNLSLWAEYNYYLINDTKVTLKKELHWCVDCNKFTPCESFEDLESVESKIAETIDMLNKYDKPLKLITSFIIPSVRWNKQFLMNSLLDHIERVKLIKLRKGSERCLCCGSQNLIPFEDNAKLIPKTWPESYSGNEPTGFVHPNCGGRIRARSSNSRFTLSISEVAYNQDGFRIE